ncbi:MAG TPA: hypothetical protein VGE02_04660 [Gemmatimonadales bacterium]
MHTATFDNTTFVQTRMATPSPAARSAEHRASTFLKRTTERYVTTLIAIFAALAVASLVLSFVVRGPASVPLLGVGLTAILALRLLAAPALRAARAWRVADTSSREDAGHRGTADHGGTSDEVHDAALDSFPASDAPSWSPLRVGAPA